MSGPTNERPIRILVVEDDPVIRLMTTHILKSCPAELAVAESADEARRQLEHEAFDVVVSDYLMPGDDGLTLVPFCVDHDIPFILLTGTVEDDYMSDPRFALVTTHLTKPASSFDLLAAVTDAAALAAPALGHG